MDVLYFQLYKLYMDLSACPLHYGKPQTQSTCVECVLRADCYASVVTAAVHVRVRLEVYLGPYLLTCKVL